MTNVWTGAITFGLVQVGIALSKATDSESSADLHQYDSATNSRIRMLRVSEADMQTAVPYERISRGREYPDGTVVLINEDELEKFSSDHTVELLAAVDYNQIDPILFEDAYYVSPTPASEKAFALLFHAAMGHNKVLIGKITIRSRPKVVVLMANHLNGETTVRMHTLRYAETVRPSVRVPIDEIKANEQELAARLVMSLPSAFYPEAFTDPFVARVNAYLDAKRTGTLTEESTTESASGTSDLMAALEASVEAAKAQRASS